MNNLAGHISDWINTVPRPDDRPLILMLSGAQGIGKSTAVRELTAHDPGICALGLDDVYLTLAERERLAREVHPLFVTRGPPGTHDLPLLNSTIDRLLTAGAHDETPLPKFSKRLDDRLPENDWPVWTGRPRIILLEGWMLGALPDDEAPFAPPCNSVEEEDPDGIWRSFQETYLRAAYSRLWDRAHAFCHIKAPDIDAILGWRRQQELDNQKVRTLTAEQDAWLVRFIQHYERITRRMLSGRHREGHVLRVDQNRSLIAS